MSIRWDVDSSQLDPEFAKDIQELFDQDPDAWAITQGFRTLEQQKSIKDLHKDEPDFAAAAPGHSAHNWGLAIDFAQIVNGKLHWDDSSPGWARIMEKVDKHPRLHGGWKFPPVAPADPDHIQAVKWYKVRQDLRLAGKW